MLTFNIGLNAACEIVICFSTSYTALLIVTTASRATVLVFAATSILSVEVPLLPFVGVKVTQSASHDASQEILPSTVMLFVVPATGAEIDSVLTLNTGPNASCEIAICFSTLYSEFETLITASRTAVFVFDTTSTLIVEVPFSPLVGVIVTQSAVHEASHEILPSMVTFFVVPATGAEIVSVLTLNVGPNASCEIAICFSTLYSELNTLITVSRTVVFAFSSTLTIIFERPFSPFVGVIVTQSAAHEASQDILLSTDTLDVAPIARELTTSVSNSILGINFCCMMLKVAVVLCSLLKNVIVALRGSMTGLLSMLIAIFDSPLLPESIDVCAHDSLDVIV